MRDNMRTIQTGRAAILSGSGMSNTALPQTRMTMVPMELGLEKENGTTTVWIARTAELTVT